MCMWTVKYVGRWAQTCALDIQNVERERETEERRKRPTNEDIWYKINTNKTKAIYKDEGDKDHDDYNRG